MVCGGGIKTIELKSYPAIACAKEAEEKGDTHFATINTNVPLPIMSIRGSPAIEGNNEYTLRKSKGAMFAETTLTNGLRIIKEFRLSETNYLFSSTVRYENTTDQPLALPNQ